MQDKSILKYLKGISSDSERELLEKWILESSENTAYFNKLNALYIASTFGESAEHVDIDNVYAEFIANNKLTQPLPKKINYSKYAIAASIVLLVSVSIYLTTRTTTVDAVANQESHFNIGSDKATLILEDGSSVEIKKGKDYKVKNAESDGEKLIYKTPQKSSKSEIVYNTIMIPRGGQFFIELADNTKVWLNSESKLKYPVFFNDSETRQVELLFGEAYFDVSPSTNHNGNTFKVITKTQEIEVLGTQFNIKAYQDEAFLYTTLVEGKVAVEVANRKVLLNPNEQAILNLGTNEVQINTIDIYNEISWKEGAFSFKRKSLKDLMQVLARWYDFETVFENKKIENIEFTGVLNKNKRIENILETIKDLGYLNSYEIKDKKIILK